MESGATCKNFKYMGLALGDADSIRMLQITSHIFSNKPDEDEGSPSGGAVWVVSLLCVFGTSESSWFGRRQSFVLPDLGDVDLQQAGS